MTTTELRKRVQARVRALSPGRLRLADDFLAYLQEREDNADTREILAIPGMRQSIARGLRQEAAGRTIPLAKVRRNV